MLDNISKYIYEVYRTKSVSEAAKKLYISQPALSTAIKKAESELGAPIFNRNKLPFTLTPEGKVYIKAIEEIMHIEEMAKNSILDISEVKSGTITVATATHTSFYAIPKLCKAFSEKYPKIDINVVFSDTEELYSKLSNKTADLIFVSDENGVAGYTTEVLFEERCVIALSRDYKGIEKILPYSIKYDDIVNRNYTKSGEISDFSIFEGVEFIYSPPRSNLYKKKRLILGDLGISRHITSSSARLQLNYNLMRSGFGALFTTDAAIATMPKTDECLYFALNNPEATRGFSVAYRSDDAGATAKLVSEFVSVAKSLFSVQNPLKILSY